MQTSIDEDLKRDPSLAERLQKAMAALDKAIVDGPTAREVTAHWAKVVVDGHSTLQLTFSLPGTEVIRTTRLTRDEMEKDYRLRDRLFLAWDEFLAARIDFHARRADKLFEQLQEEERALQDQH